MKLGRLSAALAALLVAGCGAAQPPPSGDSTLKATLVDRDGDGALEAGPAEPLRNRTELAPAARPVRTLATFAQITDAHVADEESPARLPFLDRLGPPVNSTFRPQEALQPQVLAAAVVALNRARPQAVIESGDLIDNDQRNELDQALTILHGGKVDPASGPRAYSGVQDASSADAFYYRPDVDAPRHPGLLTAAERRFESPGLRAPLYPVLGNHDFMVNGVLPPTPLTRRAAVGNRRLVGLPAGTRLPSARALTPALVNSTLGHAPARLMSRVASDPRRRELELPAVLRALRHASGSAGAGPVLRYAFDIGPRVRGIVLDTVRRDINGGVIGASQVDWLRQQLSRARRRYVVVFTHEPLRNVAGGEAALAALDRDPRVLAVVSGDTHRNSIEPRGSTRGGYWLITTSSLIDFPQQARAFRVVETAGGGVALETWMIDHGRGPGGLAAISRELAFLDAQGGRPGRFAGGRLDRNVRLFYASRR